MFVRITDRYNNETTLNIKLLNFQSISPGAVKTEIADFSNVEIPLLNPEDIAQAVLYALSTPPHVQVFIFGRYVHLYLVVMHRIVYTKIYVI